MAGRPAVDTGMPIPGVAGRGQVVAAVVWICIWPVLPSDEVKDEVSDEAEDMDEDDDEASPSDEEGGETIGEGRKVCEGRKDC